MRVQLRLKDTLTHVGDTSVVGKPLTAVMDIVKVAGDTVSLTLRSPDVIPVGAGRMRAVTVQFHPMRALACAHTGARLLERTCV
jgi:hypothetical protein